VANNARQVECYQRAVRLDQYLAVAYFQQGVSNFLVGDFEEALANFNDTLLYLRGNTYIDYEQLGLKFKLYSCEVLFNRGLCYIYLQQKQAGMGDLTYAAKEKVTPDHDVIDEAIREEADGYTVFSIPVGVVYRPNSAKVKNLKSKDYLGKARLVASAERGNVYTGFAGAENKKLMGVSDPVREAVVKDDRPPDAISYAASNLVRSDLTSRSVRQQSAPPINRNVFPPTPPPEEQARTQLPASRNSPINPADVPAPLTSRANSVKNGSLRTTASQRRPNDRPLPPLQERQMSADSAISPKAGMNSGSSTGLGFNNGPAQSNGFNGNYNNGFDNGSNQNRYQFNDDRQQPYSPPRGPADRSMSDTTQMQPLGQNPMAPPPLDRSNSERPRIGTTRSASEQPRGLTSKYSNARSERQFPPSAGSQRGRLFGEQAPPPQPRQNRDGNEADADEYPDELYDLYRNTAYSNPYTSSSAGGASNARRPSERNRSRNRSRPRADTVNTNNNRDTFGSDGGASATSPSTHSSLDDFEILNDAGGTMSRPRDMSRSRGTSRSRRPIDIRTIRVKVRHGDDTRYVMVSTGIVFEEFTERVRDKLSLRGAFKIKIKDEGDLITMADRDDWEMAVQGARREARKREEEMAKMEVSIADELSLESW
jgi:hypothetical protein